MELSNLWREWFFISGQWSWDDSEKIHTVSIIDDLVHFKKNKTDDRRVVKTLRDLISDADILVGHNIKAHDLKNLKAKIVEYRLKPPKMPLIVDTLTWAREFGFTSRKLGDLCKKLSLEHKLSHSAGVFLRAAMGDKEAIKEIVEYGKGDIPTLRQLYKILRPYAKSHPNNNLFRGDNIECCPRCGGMKFKNDGKVYTQSTVRQQFRCKAPKCNHVFTSIKRIKGARVK